MTQQRTSSASAVSFNHEHSAAPAVNPDPTPINSPIVPAVAWRIAQATLQLNAAFSIDSAVVVVEVFRFTGDGPPSSPRLTWIWWLPVYLNNYENSATAISDPDTTPITIRTPRVILATRCIAQLPLQPDISTQA